MHKSAHINACTLLGTALANHTGMNLTEVRNSARHSSVLASLSYQRRDATSEMNKFSAISGHTNGECVPNQSDAKSENKKMAANEGVVGESNFNGIANNVHFISKNDRDGNVIVSIPAKKKLQLQV